MFSAALLKVSADLWGLTTKVHLVFLVVVTSCMYISDCNVSNGH